MKRDDAQEASAAKGHGTPASATQRATGANTVPGQMQRSASFTDRFSEADRELAAKIENDIVEGIDGGETREQLRIAVHYWACAELDERERRSVSESEKTLAALERLGAVLQKSDNASSVPEAPKSEGGSEFPKSGSSMESVERNALSLDGFFLSLPANRGFRYYEELNVMERATVKLRCPYCGTTKEENNHTDTCPVGKLNALSLQMEEDSEEQGKNE